MYSFLLTSVLVWGAAEAVQNGRGRTPVMGYNSYNDIGCSPNGTYMQATIDAMSAQGFVDLGYRYFQIDCGWQGYDRLSNGSITYDAAAFPSGIAPLSQRAISKGMKWSMYTDQGVYSCDTSSKHRPGSLGYEKQDAAMMAAWNTVYVKVDNCWVNPNENAPKDPDSGFVTRYTTMWNALNQQGINEMLVCQWGTPYQDTSNGNVLEGPAQWTPQLSTSYRVSDDIAQGWANVMRITNQAINVALRGLTGPGNFADMDLLEVGNPGLTVAEQQSHFAIWALFKSALMISTPVAGMSSTTKGIFSNKNLIAVNQDSLGAPVKLVQRFSGDYDVFAGPLANTDMAVLLLDQTNTARSLTLNLSMLGVASATVTNLWTGTATKATGSWATNVSPHGCAALRLSNISKASSTAPSVTYYQASSGTLSGGANVQSCSGCSNGQKVGYLSNGGGSVTITGIRTSQSTSNVAFDYINCDIGYLSSQGPNVRGASISVNGGPAVQVQFPISGYNWDKDVLKSFLVQLSGFNTKNTNTITITGSSLTQYAPDLDRIAVVN